MGLALVAMIEPDWEGLVALHGRVVWLSVVALGVPPEQARDIAQEAWARLYERRATFARLELPGLAITQARYLARDALRRTRIEHKHVVASDAIDRSDPESHAISRERLQRATEVLGRCTEQQQRVFRATYDDPSRPHAAIAEEVGLSTQRVRQILCEVRRKLQTAMETE
jgi:RNA polymerase sigma factor (sigma-70 family)